MNNSVFASTAAFLYVYSGSWPNKIKLGYADAVLFVILKRNLMAYSVSLLNEDLIFITE